MIRRLRLALLRWQLASLESERAAYQKACPQRLGANYLANCADQERDLRGRIACLEVGL